MAHYPKLSTLIPTSNNTLPEAALRANIIPGLGNSLISTGQLCNNGCIGVFTKDWATILKDDDDQITKTIMNMSDDHNPVFKGYRNTQDGLWHINLTNSKHHEINALNSSSTIAQRVAYYHACLGSPPLSTLCQAINSGHLVTFPSLTSAQVRKYPPLSMAMHKGHLDQTKANQL